MSDELLYVTKAAKTMKSCGGTPKERLIKAAAEFALATKRPGDWPPELLAKAKKVCALLFIDGSFRGKITSMDSKTCLLYTSSIFQAQNGCAAVTSSVRATPQPLIHHACRGLAGSIITVETPPEAPSVVDK